jgi:hypothetical protein
MKRHFGKDSIFIMRFLYLLYTAKIHEEGHGYLEVLDDMERLQIDSEPVKNNQYLFKAKIIDCMILMQQVAQK